MTKTRRQMTKGLALAALTATGVASFGTTAFADDFPSEPVNIVVAWPAGGSHDRVARLMSDYLAEELGQPIVVTNTTGAAGTVGVRTAATADADGYTIGMMGLHVVAQTYMMDTAAPWTSVAPLALIEQSPAALSVRTETGINTLDEFVEKVKSDPEFILSSNDGPGGFANNTAVLAKQALGVDFATIPYQGYGPAIGAIKSGETNATTIPGGIMIGLAEGGDIKILGMASEERHFRAPDVPTFKESGYDFVFGDFVGMFLPEGVPADHAAVLETAVMNVLADEAFLEAAVQAGMIVSPGGSEDFAAFLADQDATVYPILEANDLVSVNAK